MPEHRHRVEQALQHARDRLSDVESEMLVLRARADAYRAEIAGLERALSQPTAFEDLPLADAIVAVLLENSGPMSPAAIHERLEAGGRSDDKKLISGMLNWLQKGGRVTKVARAQWVARRDGVP